MRSNVMSKNQRADPSTDKIYIKKKSIVNLIFLGYIFKSFS
jgi:hypothetical protein